MHVVNIYMKKIQRTKNAISKQNLNITIFSLVLNLKTKSYNPHSFGNAQKPNKLLSFFKVLELLVMKLLNFTSYYDN